MKNNLIIFIIFIAFLFIFYSSNTQNIYRNNESRTGYIDTKGVPVLHGIKWKYETELVHGSLKLIDESIIIYKDKSLFKCININDGKEIDNKINKYSLFDTYKNIEIYVQTIYDNKSPLIYAVDKTINKQIWELKDINGFIYFIGLKKTISMWYEILGTSILMENAMGIYFINPVNGKIEKSFIQNCIYDNIYIKNINGIANSDENIIFSTSNELFLIKVEDNYNLSKIYECKKDRKFLSFPVISKNNVLFRDSQGFLYSYNLKLKKLNWEVKCKGERGIDGFFNPPSIYDGIVYLSTGEYFYYINEINGEILYEIFMKDHIIHYPCTITNDGIYFASRDSYIYCYDLKNATKKWELKLSNYCDLSPIVSNGYIYISAFDGYNKDSKGYVFAIY